MASEHLSKESFPERNPILQLESMLTPNEEDINGNQFKKFYGIPSEVNFAFTGDYVDEIRQSWPESKEELNKRTMLLTEH